jgi:AraC-like DNA-binding protein
MAEVSKIPHIIYSCLAQRSRGGEQFVPMYILTYLIAGTSQIYMDGEMHHFASGEYRFMRRNQLASFTKHPPAIGDYRAVSIAIDQATLRSMSDELNLHPARRYSGQALLRLPQHILLQSYFDSLEPYINDPAELSTVLTNLKVREAVMILLQLRPELNDLLFDFSEPGKIDLEAFMNANYRFNVGLDRFAYLTGRSLATFKRDFEKIFQESPSRWLVQKRLEDAYFLLSVRKRRVGEVFAEVGFKDLSHFSQAFKKAYGVAPSQLA